MGLTQLRRQAAEAEPPGDGAKADRPIMKDGLADVVAASPSVPVASVVSTNGLPFEAIFVIATGFAA